MLQEWKNKAAPWTGVHMSITCLYLYSRNTRRARRTARMPADPARVVVNSLSGPGTMKKSF